MCLRNDVERSEATRLRRQARILAASCCTFAAAPFLSLTHGHSVFGWILIAVQLCLLGAATKLFARAKRIG